MRSSWRAPGLAWIVTSSLTLSLTSSLSSPAHAQADRPVACGDTLAQPGRAVIAADGLQLAHAPSAWPLPVGRPFGLDIVLCPASTASTALPPLLQVDADMPAHRHGLNYRVALRQTGPGRYRAEGVLLHMPGRWRLVFDLGPAEAPRRLVRVVDVE